jgi:hypothetical protein
MRQTRLKHAYSLSLTLSLCLATPALWAQWAWRDANGIVQYSDTPPPSSVPRHRIVKQPGVAVDPPSPASANEPTASASAESEAGTPSWVEQNAEFMRRREQRLEEENKAREEKQAAAEKKKNCAQARENLRLLEAGHPVRQASANGGMEYMGDGQRNAEMKQMREYLKDCR